MDHIFIFKLSNKNNEIISKIILFLTALFHRISLYFTVNYLKFSEIIGNLCVFSLEF